MGTGVGPEWDDQGGTRVGPGASTTSEEHSTQTDRDNSRSIPLSATLNKNAYIHHLYTRKHEKQNMHDSDEESDPGRVGQAKHL